MTSLVQRIEMREALKVVEHILNEHYKTSDIIFSIKFRQEDHEAYEKNEYFHMDMFYRSHDLSSKINTELKKYGLYLEWRNNVCFWLYNI